MFDAHIISLADNGRTIQASVGGELVLRLDENPTTGFIWQWSEIDANSVLPSGDNFLPPLGDMVGAGGVRLIRLRILRPGCHQLRLTLRQPWNSELPPAADFTIWVQAV